MKLNHFYSSAMMALALNNNEVWHAVTKRNQSFSFLEVKTINNLPKSSTPFFLKASHVFLYCLYAIGQMSRMFCQGSGRPGFNSQVELYQRLKKWCLMPPCSTLSIISYGSRVKWRNLGKGIAAYRTHRCCSYWKGSLRVAHDNGRQVNFFFLCLKTQNLLNI